MDVLGVSKLKMNVGMRVVCVREGLKGWNDYDGRDNGG